MYHGDLLSNDSCHSYYDTVPIYPDVCDPAEQGMDHCRQLVESGNYTSIQFFTKKYQLMEIPKSVSAYYVYLGYMVCIIFSYHISILT